MGTRRQTAAPPFNDNNKLFPNQAEKVQQEVDGFNIWNSISKNGPSGRNEVLLNFRLSSMILQKPEPVFISPTEYGPDKPYLLSEYEEDILDETQDDFFVIRNNKWKMFSGNYIEQGWTAENNLQNNVMGGKSNGGAGEGIKLYNLDTDPREENNVAKDQPRVVKKLMSKMAEYKEKMTWIGTRTNSKNGNKDGTWYPWVTLE